MDDGRPDGVGDGEPGDQGAGQAVVSTLAVVEGPSGSVEHRGGRVYGHAESHSLVRGAPLADQNPLDKRRRDSEVAGGHEQLEPDESQRLQVIQLAVEAGLELDDEVRVYLDLLEDHRVRLGTGEHPGVPERLDTHARGGRGDEGDARTGAPVRVLEQHAGREQVHRTGEAARLLAPADPPGLAVPDALHRGGQDALRRTALGEA